MAEGLYEVHLRFQETGTGEARILPPDILEQVEWRYVQVNGVESKAIMRIEDAAEALGDESACRALTEEQVDAKRRSWPRPKLKQKYLESAEDHEERLPDHADAPSGEQTPAEPTTMQTVRWGFYLIDVPVDPADVVG